MEQFLKDYGQLISVSLIPIFIWILGIQFQNRSAKRKAKLELFLNLMADRKKNPPTVRFADSLNMIDVVFQKDKKVRATWRSYYDSLHPNSQHNASSNSFLLDLLSEIANSLTYLDLKQTEIDRFYVPQFFVNQLNGQAEISDEVLRVLKASENYGTPKKMDGNKNTDV
jgi:hypothetical protein